MTKKIFLSGLAGFVTYYLLGWLAYGILFTENTTGEESLIFIALGCLFHALIFAVLFTCWADITTFSSGLKVGAVLGLLYALSWYFFMLTGSFDLMYFLKEMVTNIVMSALTSGVVAYVGGKVS